MTVRHKFLLENCRMKPGELLPRTILKMNKTRIAALTLDVTPLEPCVSPQIKQYPLFDEQRATLQSCMIM